MSVLTVFRWQGDPDALLAAYDGELQHPVPREQPHRVTHICVRGDNEVVIVDLWESDQDLQRMMEDPGVPAESRSCALAVGADRADLPDTCDRSHDQRIKVLVAALTMGFAGSVWQPGAVHAPSEPSGSQRSPAVHRWPK
jgi:hypothetical protein